MQHKLLIQRTQTCLRSAEDREEAENVLYIRDELFSFIKLLLKDKLDMARTMSMNGNKNGFHLTHDTTARLMYQFFTQAITELYDDLEADISISSTADSIPTAGSIIHHQEGTPINYSRMKGDRRTFPLEMAALLNQKKQWNLKTLQRKMIRPRTKRPTLIVTFIAVIAA